MSRTVDIPPELVTALRKFRFRHSSESAAMVVRIDKKQLKMVQEDIEENISLEELAEELPENSPRYVVLSYEVKHDDGRTNYPLVIINWLPRSSEMGMSTLHASALIDFQSTADIQRIIEIRDGAEGLREAIDAKLK
ncbi:hypothetical protein M0805_002753 [Coniferiporia weirii]|nr:hypothetical protein M0805_002753 [Coniferiporia weirii]